MSLTSIGYDTIEPAKAPNGAACYFGYVSGNWSTSYAAAKALHPNVPVFSISTNLQTDADAGDFETGDMTIAQSPTWLARQIARGIIPMAYCSVSLMQSLINYNASRGVSKFYTWSAHYTSQAHLCGPQCGYGLKKTVDLTQWSSNYIPLDTDLVSNYVLGISTPTAPSGGNVDNFVAMAITPSGRGYWQVKSDGSIITDGDAIYLGGANVIAGQPVTLNAPIVDIESHPLAQGYWLVASDGGVFTFGAAQFFGSMGGQKLNQPITGIKSTPTGNGYWLCAKDGGIFTFGDAVYEGSGVGD